MYRRVWLIRHAQSQGNSDGLIQGHIDAPLTELGLNQAAATAEHFVKHNSEFSIERAFASDLQRAALTAKTIAEALSLEVSYHRGLREAYFGKWEGLSAHEVAAQDPAAYSAWMNDKSWRPSWCESFEELQDRCLLAWKEILASVSGNCLVVSHGGAIHALLKHWLKDRSQLPAIQNCGITELNVAKGGTVTVDRISYLAPGVAISPEMLQKSALVSYR